MKNTFINLPCAIKGFTVVTAEPDGDFYNIVINPKHSIDTQKKTFEHEQNHITHDDFYGINADQIEEVRHD